MSFIRLKHNHNVMITSLVTSCNGTLFWMIVFMIEKYQFSITTFEVYVIGDYLYGYPTIYGADIDHITSNFSYYF